MTEKKSNIGVVFLLHNNFKELCANLGNLSQTDNKLFLLIIDNGSKDETKSECKEAKIPFVDIEVNVGFTKAVNIGVELLINKYDLDWIFIITPDIEIKPFWDKLLFESLTDFEQFDDIGTISPLIVDFCGVPMHCGIELEKHPFLDMVETFTIVKDVIVKKNESLGLTNVKKVVKILKSIEFRPAVQFYFTGFRPQIWQEFGKLDEKYEFYGADITYSLNIGKKYKNIVCPVVFRHIGMRSFIMNLCLDDGKAIEKYKHDRLLLNKELMLYGSYNG